MSFTCSLCGLDIAAGEPMISDDKMCLAHETCVQRGRNLIDPPTAIYIPPQTVSPPPIVVVQTKISGPGFGNLTASIEPCLMPSRGAVCIECQKAAISMCPTCREYVHQDFGYNGNNCSGRHETRCPGSAELRTPKKSIEVWKAPENGTSKVNLGVNGKHVRRIRKERRKGRR